MISGKACAFLAAVAASAGLLPAGPAIAKVVHIRYMHWGSNMALEDTVKEWNRSHPGIQVRYDNTGDSGERIAVMMAAGTPPDIFSSQSWTGYFQKFARNGAVVDLTPLFRANKKELRLDNFFPETLNAAKVDGKYYGMPLGWMNYGFICYNADMVKQAGFSPPVRDWTYDDYVVMAKKMTVDTNGDGRTDIFGTNSPPFGFPPDAVVNAGGRIFDKSGTKLDLGSPEAIRGLTWVQELNTKFHVLDNGLEVPSGKLAMAYRNVPQVIWDAFRVGKKFDCAVALQPKDPTTGMRRSWADVNFLTVSKGSKYPKECWEFLEWFNAVGYPEAARRSFGVPQLVPPLKSVAKSDIYLKPDRTKILGLDMNLIVEGCEKYTYELQGNYGAVQDILNREFAPVILGKLSVAQFVSRVTRPCNEALARYAKAK